MFNILVSGTDLNIWKLNENSMSLNAASKCLQQMLQDF